MTVDADVVEAMKHCAALRVTIHIRGTDERPVIQFRDKLDRREVGGSEMRRRMREGIWLTTDGF